MACLLLLAAWAKALSWPQIAQMASGLLAVVALPLLYVLQADTKIPGQGSTWTDPITHGSYTMKLIQVIEHRDLGTGIITDRLLALSWQEWLRSRLGDCVRLELVMGKRAAEPVQKDAAYFGDL